MLPLQPSVADDRTESLSEFIEANGLPDEWQPDPEDFDPLLSAGTIPELA